MVLQLLGYPHHRHGKSRLASVWWRSFRRPNRNFRRVQQLGRNFVSGVLLLLQAHAVDHVLRALSSSDLEA